ncbi:MAG: hypothetical protein ACPGUV_05275 [Polyangiales bacterium]
MTQEKLAGRCGSCVFFHAWSTDEHGQRTGECRLGCWPSPLKDSATCSHYKAYGSGWQKPKTPKRRRAGHVPAAPRAPEAPRFVRYKEIGIDMEQDEFRQVLREIVLDELGLRPAPMGERWQGGELVLCPGREGTQEKRIPLEQFFHKVVMVREKLRVLEQKINGNAKLSDAEKVQLQQYITGCYGSLTTFNLLFRDREDGFQGQKSSP